MKIPQIKNNISLYLNILVTIVILTIPLYALRLPIANTSISILTINMLILSITLFIFYHKNILTIFKKESLLWIFALLFIFSFIPSLMLSFTTHGGGVFVEWIFLPALTSFLLYIHTIKNPHAFITIQNALILNLFIISIIALIYLILDIKTFDGRLSVFYPSPNHLALFITPLIPITFAHFFTTKNLSLKIFSLLTISLSLFVLYFTNSFISSASLIIVFTFITFIHIKKNKLFFVFLLLFFVLLTAISFHKITNIEHEFTHNPLFSRIEIWTVATHHLQNNSLLNTSSLDNFQQIYLDAQPMYMPYNNWSAPTPHNLMLTLWISGGFFTVLFFCLICTRWIYLNYTIYNKTKNATALLYIASFFIIILSGIFDTPFWKNDLSFIFWILISISYFDSKTISLT